MPDQNVAFVTPATAPRWQRWLVLSPLARIVIFTLVFFALLIAMGTVFNRTGWPGHHATPVAGSVAQLLLRAVPELFAYLVLVKLVERRPMTELALRKLLPDGLAGLLAGALLFSAVVGVMYLLGIYHVEGTNPDASWLPALLVMGLGAGIGEEILFRGVLYRILEEGLGTWWALLVSALLFGALHIVNPGATPWSSAAIAIEAGLLFGLLYHVTRSLYLCMGVHAAWNFMQGMVYGIPVSGASASGWLVSSRTGPRWLSGGIFGAEASVIALALCLMCSIALLAIALRRRGIVPPLVGSRVAAPGSLPPSSPPCG